MYTEHYNIMKKLEISWKVEDMNTDALSYISELLENENGFLAEKIHYKCSHPLIYLNLRR